MNRPTALAVAAALAAALAACTPTTGPADPTGEPTATAPAPESTPDAAGEPDPAPAGPHDPQAIADGLTTPPGTVLVAPAEPVTRGEVTGWWAVLEVTGDDLAAIADDLGAQLTRAGMSVQITEVGDVVVVRGEGVTGQVARFYDVQVIPAGGDLPAQVQILAAAEPVTS